MYRHVDRQKNRQTDLKHRDTNANTNRQTYADTETGNRETDGLADTDMLTDRAGRMIERSRNVQKYEHRHRPKERQTNGPADLQTQTARRQKPGTTNIHTRGSSTGCQ